MAEILSQVRGHEEPTRILLDAFAKDRVPSSFLFVGPSGVGKFKMALAFVQMALCSNRKVRACGTCPDCEKVSHAQHPSLLVLEPEKDVIKVERAKEAVRFLSLQMEGQRFVVINDAHMLNQQAANALLKSIEEPPDSSHFILVAPTSSLLLPTIRSRSQILKFKPLSSSDLREISGEEGWVIEAAQGRLDLLNQLTGEEFSQARSQTLKALLEGLRPGGRGLDSMPDVVSDRSLSLFAVRCFRQLVRDAFVHRARQAVAYIHQDQVAAIDELARFKNLDCIPQLVDELEKDLEANVDRKLSFSRFFVSLENYHQDAV